MISNMYRSIKDMAETLLQHRTLPQWQQKVRISLLSSVMSAKKKQISITHIWNRVTNFVTRSGYPVAATNH